MPEIKIRFEGWISAVIGAVLMFLILLIGVFIFDPFNKSTAKSVRDQKVELELSTLKNQLRALQRKSSLEKLNHLESVLGVCQKLRDLQVTMEKNEIRRKLEISLLSESQDSPLNETLAVALGQLNLPATCLDVMTGVYPSTETIADTSVTKTDSSDAEGDNNE